MAYSAKDSVNTMAKGIDRLGHLIGNSEHTGDPAGPIVALLQNEGVGVKGGADAGFLG